MTRGEPCLDVSFVGPIACEIAVERFRERLASLVRGRRSATAVLRVQCAEAASDAPRLDEDESFELTVGGGEGVDLIAKRPVGVVRGLATLLQLVEIHDTESSWSLRETHIVDAPRFPWRGLLIDSARHFLPVELLERQLEAMELAKLNVLHWHLCDDQAFRVECDALPRLHQLGSAGSYYTRDEIRGLVRFAAERGIRVVPEFGMPGHATSWLVGYPELGGGGGPYELATTFGPMHACIDPTKPEVWDFLERFFADVLPLFPDEYVHIGGDEVSGIAWQQDPAIAAFMVDHGMKHARELQAWFNARLQPLLADHGKRMVGWEEIAGGTDGPLSGDPVIQCWQSAESLASVAAAGQRCLLSHGYYLNELSSSRAHYDVDPLAAAELQRPEAKARILGGEACMWTEFVDAGNFDSRAWPRAAAIADRLWSRGDARDEADLASYLDSISRILALAGVQPEAAFELRALELGFDLESDAVRTLLDLLVPRPIVEGDSPRDVDVHTALDHLSDLVPPHRSELMALTRELYDETSRPALERRLESWRELDVHELPAQHLPLGERLRTLGDLATRLLAGKTVESSEFDPCAESVEGLVLGAVEILRAAGMHADRRS